MAEKKECGQKKPDGERGESENIDAILGLLKSSWRQFDATGSHVLVQLTKALAGSQYEGVFKDTVALLGPVFACGQSELVLRRLRDMENLLGSPGHGSSAKTDGGKVVNNKQVITLFALPNLNLCP